MPALYKSAPRGLKLSPLGFPFHPHARLTYTASARGGGPPFRALRTVPGARSEAPTPIIRAVPLLAVVAEPNVGRVVVGVLRVGVVFGVGVVSVFIRRIARLGAVVGVEIAGTSLLAAGIRHGVIIPRMLATWWQVLLLQDFPPALLVRVSFSWFVVRCELNR